MNWNPIKLLIIILLVAGISIYSYPPLLQGLNLGLDLRGGIHILLEAEETEEVEITNEIMEQLVAVMRHRVDELGVSEPYIQRAGGPMGRRIVVEIPGIDDPETARDIIGRTASLEFRLPNGEVFLTGYHLQTASASIDGHPPATENVVNLNFNAVGARIFGDVTTHMATTYPHHDPRRYIYIYLDGDQIQRAHVLQSITGGQARISGNFIEFEQAANLAALLRAGALPVDVEIKQLRLIGPQLGVEAIERSQMALIIGITFIFLFMMIVYKLNGIVANISLVLYGVILLALLSGINAVLTLPGIAGLLLSVGLAIDANIIIYERIKEELRTGKSLRAAVDAGFKRATLTILDANITSLVASLVLFMFGTGLIRGFAVTLSLGIVVSLFTSLIFTRILLRTIVRIKMFQNTGYYGVKEGN